MSVYTFIKHLRMFLNKCFDQCAIVPGNEVKCNLVREKKSMKNCQLLIKKTLADAMYLNNYNSFIIYIDISKIFP